MRADDNLPVMVIAAAVLVLEVLVPPTVANAADLWVGSADVCNDQGVAVAPRVGESFWVRVNYFYRDPTCDDYVIRRAVDGDTIDAPPLNWGCGYSGLTSWVHVWGVWNLCEPGSYSVTVVLDALDGVAEDNEANNTFTFDFEVSPDPADSDPTLSFPLGGLVGRDISACTFFDHRGCDYSGHDPGSSMSTFLCEPWTYFGHSGNDFGIGGFEAMDVAPVAVFAAMDGTVVHLADGYDDRRTDCNHGDPACGNFVEIDHGDGHTTVYCHLQQNSTLVTVGQPVTAGEQIGSVGSSGCSSGPHLHFGTVRSGLPFDPLIGDCNATPPIKFARQPEFNASVMSSVKLSHVCEGTDLPGKYYFGPTETLVTVECDFAYVPENTVIRWEWVQNGLTYASVEQGPFSDYACGQSWRWCFFRPAGIGPGAVRIYFNGALAWQQPYLAVAAVPPLNEAPFAPEARFQVPPQADKVTWVEVTHPALDPDYDLVRYRYEWLVDDTLARDHTTVALTDALSSAQATCGSRVRCRVTPADDLASGESVEMSGVFVSSTSGALDFDCDLDWDLCDFAVLQQCFGGPATPECIAADFDGNGNIDLADHAAFASLLSGPQ